MKITKQKLLLLFIIITILINIFTLFNFNNKKIYERDIAILSTLDINKSTNIIYDNHNKPIINCDFITYSKDLKLNYTFYQNAKDDNIYKLLIFIDDKQHKFIVKGKSYDSYDFTLDGRSNIDIDIQLNLKNKNSQNIVFVTYKDPYYKAPKSEDEVTSGTILDAVHKWDELNSETYSTRIFFKGSDFENLLIKNYSEKLPLPYSIIRKGTGSGIPFGTSNEEFDLVFFSEEYDTEIFYKAIYLLNYEQIQLNKDSNDIISLTPNSVFNETKLILPQVENCSTFNILLLPYINSEIPNQNEEVSSINSESIDMSIRHSARFTIFPLE